MADSISNNTNEKLTEIDTAVDTGMTAIQGKQDLINQSVTTGFGDTETALNQIKTSVEGDFDVTQGKIDDVVTKVGDAITTIGIEQLTVYHGKINSESEAKYYLLMINTIEEDL